jgi:hypothetical protein
MHFEFLVEGSSDKKALDILVPKLLGDKITYRIHSYKGQGRIPKNLKPNSDARKRMLLAELPRLLQGYGNAKTNWHIVIVCDLDDREKNLFLEELHSVLNACDPKPDASFCLAVEELEAWYLGDLDAVRKVYPRVKMGILNTYRNDSICGTWELLADAVCNGGHKALSERGWQAVGEQKFIWAKEISAHMNVDENDSPSFRFFRSKIREIAALTA